MQRSSIFAGLVLAVGLSSAAYGGTAYYTGTLDSSSPTFDAPGGTNGGTGVQYYSAQPFTVDATGSYTFETASVNSTGTPSNAIDTLLNLYANTFTPAAPNDTLATADDFVGTLTILPGPYAGNGVTATATGASGAQPSSRFAAQALTAGVQYFLINTSFRNTDYTPAGTVGGATGTFYTGISGPGNITVPEPASLGLLGLGGLALMRRRRA